MQDPDPHAVCLRGVAERRGIPHDIVMGSRYVVAARVRPWLRLDFGPRAYFFAAGVLLDGARPQGAALGRLVNGRADMLSRDKGQANAIMRAAGVAVPDGKVFHRGETAAAVEYALSLGGPVCVKPTTGSYGFMVTPELEEPTAIAAAFERTMAKFRSVLVERSIRGVDLRCFFVWPRVVAMVLALPPTVTGDGRSDIASLIAAKNAERAERNLPGCFPILPDDDLHAVLAREGLALSSVPAPGRKVVLRHVVNRAVGGECINPVGLIHPSYARVAEAACRAVPELLISAIDMKVDDPAQPAAPGNHCVLEVNASPGLLPFHYPWEGPPQDIGGAILDFLAAGGPG